MKAKRIQPTYLKQCTRHHVEKYKGHTLELTAGVDTITNVKPWEVFEGEDFVVEVVAEELAGRTDLWPLTCVVEADAPAGDGSCFDWLMFDSAAARKFYQSMDGEPFLEDTYGAPGLTKDERIADVIRVLFNYWRNFAVGWDCWLMLSVRVLDTHNRPLPGLWSAQRMLTSGEMFSETWKEALEGARLQIDMLVSGN